MKKMMIILAAIIISGGILTSCTVKPPEPAEETETVPATDLPVENETPAPAAVFDVDSIGDYSIVYASEPVGLESVADQVRDKIQAATGKSIPVLRDTDSAESEHEILVGPTNRAFSQACYADSSHIMQYEIRTQDGKLQLVIGGPYSGLKCAEEFSKHVLAAKEKLSDGVPYYAADLAEDSQELTEGADIRVMSSNVLNYHWGEETYPNLYPVATRCEIYAGVLLRFKPDIIGLQEADANWRDALPYYLNSMAAKEKISYTHLLPNVEWKGKTVINYCSLLYRSDLYDVDESGFKGFEANYQSSYCQRVGVYAKFTGKNDASRQMIIVNTHWAHESDERILSCVNEEAALVNELKARYPDIPVFCTGDFNSNIKMKARDWEDNKTTDPEGYKNAKNRYEHFLDFVEQAGGIIVGKMAILAEGEAFDRKDIIALQYLPLFNAEGEPIAK